MKNLVIASVGDDSLHSKWIDNSQEFDLMLIYFGKNDKIGNIYKSQSQYYFSGSEFSNYKSKYSKIKKIIENNLDIITKYSHIWLPDDDVMIKYNQINRLFKIANDYNLSICQPCMGGYISHEITKKVEGNLLRYTNFVEVLAPLFNLETLLKLYKTFDETESSWGLDYLWPFLLHYPLDKIAIIDDIEMIHTKPVGRDYSRFKISPNEEMETLLKKYNISDYFPKQHESILIDDILTSSHIVIHLLPQEIDWFEWQIKQLKLGSFYLSKNDKILIDVTLNLNLINWENSKLPKEFFIDKFKQIEKLCDWCETSFMIDEHNIILGCNDKRRHSIRNSSYNNIIFLDPDIIFTPEILKYLINASKILHDKYYIITPQTTQLWDNSWDDIVNNSHKHLNYEELEDRRYDSFLIYWDNYEDEINLKSKENFKFGGGWFNLFSANLLKFIDIPESLKGYGEDDLFLMVGCELLNEKKYDIKQYVLENSLISENVKYRFNPYNNFLHFNNIGVEFKENSKKNLHSEVLKFETKLNHIHGKNNFLHP